MRGAQYARNTLARVTKIGEIWRFFCGFHEIRERQTKSAPIQRRLVQRGQNAVERLPFAHDPCCLNSKMLLSVQTVASPKSSFRDPDSPPRFRDQRLGYDGAGAARPQQTEGCHYQVNE